MELHVVRQRCYWPGMSLDIRNWVQECERCQVTKDTAQAPHSFMGHLAASRPNEILAIDFTLHEPSNCGHENVSQPSLVLGQSDADAGILRCTSRSTAGCHNNIHHLPRPAGGQVSDSTNRPAKIINVTKIYTDTIVYKSD